MTIIKRILILIPLSLSLSACNTVYKQQNSCLSKDWFTSGFDAAKNGLEINSQWSNISQLCVENNIWVDRHNKYLTMRMQMALIFTTL